MYKPRAITSQSEKSESNFSAAIPEVPGSRCLCGYSLGAEGGRQSRAGQGEVTVAEHLLSPVGGV